ncbi:MAG: DUF4349 domain-containing protein, partial [Chloroflexi bacterium]|nr:DUF4349 domain-containing protein [Chloroflexota bacterium]
RELARVRSEIERLQGQLNFLKRRVELATITVALVPPQQEAVVPPSASLAVGVPDVAGSVEAIKALVAGLGGVVDRASLSVKDGKETARLSLRVFGAQFDQALRSLEGQGKVSSKEVQEGKAPKDGEAARPKEPDARIEVSLAEKKPRWPAVVALIAVVVVVGGFAFGGYVTGRYWARRSGTAS